MPQSMNAFDCPVPPEVNARHLRLLKAAQAALVTPEATQDFLHGEHAELGGRPLDIALASNAGLLAVERAISTEAYKRGAAS